MSSYADGQFSLLFNGDFWTANTYAKQAGFVRIPPKYLSLIELCRGLRSGRRHQVAWTNAAILANGSAERPPADIRPLRIIAPSG